MHILDWLWSKSFGRAFDAHVAGVLERLDGRLATLTDPRMRHVEVVMANHGLVDASFQQLVLLSQTISPALGDIVKDIRSFHSAFLTDLQKTSGQFIQETGHRDEEVSMLRSHIESSEGEIQKLMEVADLLDKVLHVVIAFARADMSISPFRFVGGR